MANNRFPYGDAFLVQTPYLDRVGAMMINDQKQREANQAKEAQALDQEFGKNISGMRDADIPELTQKWGEYKNLKKQLYKDGSKLDDNKRIELQLEAQRKLGDAYKHINKSKAEKEQEETYAKDVLKNPDKYDDIATQFLMERRMRPVSQFQAALPNIGGMKGGTLDFADIPGNIEYKLGTTNFTPVISKAKGTQSLRGEPIDVVSPDGLTTTRTQYKAVNSPTEYIKQLQAGVVGSKKTKHLPLEFNYSDDEANQIINDYAKLRETDAFKKAYPNEPEISSTLMATPTGRAMALMAMENAVLHPPVPIVSKPFNNTGAVMGAKNAEWDRRNKLTFDQSKEKIRLNKEAGAPPPNTGYLSDEIFDSDGEDLTVKFNGQEAKRRVVFTDKVDPERLDIMIGKDLSKKKLGIEAIDIKVPDGKGGFIVKKGYYQDPITGDIEGKNGQKASRERIKDDYINKYSSSKYKASTNTKAVEKKGGTPVTEKIILKGTIR